MPKIEVTSQVHLEEKVIPVVIHDMYQSQNGIIQGSELSTVNLK